MAGGGHFQPVRLDPALERWNFMRENVYQNFKFTKRATRSVLLFTLVFPAVIAGIAIRYDNKYDWAGKLKGESLLRNAPAAKAEEE
ncbi:hypothetical protein JCM24511_00587 [Saitozyma sp. JCM 24511]|nr:hypothetical protein JCM24511_00587 [Saitozyma sp. JCM 24511]